VNEPAQYEVVLLGAECISPEETLSLCDELSEKRGDKRKCTRVQAERAHITEQTQSTEEGVRSPGWSTKANCEPRREILDGDRLSLRDMLDAAALRHAGPCRYGHYEPFRSLFSCEVMSDDLERPEIGELLPFLPRDGVRHEYLEQRNQTTVAE
jgi:hypothetical protein